MCGQPGCKGIFYSLRSNNMEFSNALSTAVNIHMSLLNYSLYACIVEYIQQRYLPVNLPLSALLALIDFDIIFCLFYVTSRVNAITLYFPSIYTYSKTTNYKLNGRMREYICIACRTTVKKQDNK